MNFRLVAFVFFVVTSLFVHAEDPDKNLDDAVNEAANAAKKMGVKMPDVKKQLEEIDKEEAKEKSRFAETARSTGPVKLSDWTPKLPQFNADGPAV